MEIEIIIALVVVAGLLYWFFHIKKEVVAPALEATPEPYKVETPTIVEVAPVVEEVKAEAPAPVVEAPAKKPRKPRAPKAETTEKKAAPKKAAAAKAAPKVNSKKV
jgi:hypothetical protein